MMARRRAILPTRLNRAARPRGQRAATPCRKMRCCAGASPTLLIAAMLVAGSARAETVEDFYRGKTITMYVGTGVGAGAVSAYPMALAPVIKKYIPGNPNVVVSHMPGAGGIKAASYIESIAPQDGTAWGFITRGFMLAPLLKLPQANSIAAKFNWIGSPSRTVSMGLSLERLDRRAHDPGRDAQGGRGRRHHDRAGHRHLPARAQPHRRHQVQDRHRLCGPRRRRPRAWSAARCKARSARPGNRSTAGRAPDG